MSILRDRARQKAYAAEVGALNAFPCSCGHGIDEHELSDSGFGACDELGCDCEKYTDANDAEPCETCGRDLDCDGLCSPCRVNEALYECADNEYDSMVEA